MDTNKKFYAGERGSRRNCSDATNSENILSEYIDAIIDVVEKKIW